MPRDELAERVARATEWVSGRKSDSLHGVVSRYGTLRKFTPAFLEAVSFLQEDGSENGPCLQALAVLRDLNASNKRKLSTGTATASMLSHSIGLSCRRGGSGSLAQATRCAARRGSARFPRRQAAFSQVRLNRTRRSNCSRRAPVTLKPAIEPAQTETDMP